jgi:hypothetical protein
MSTTTPSIHTILTIGSGDVTQTRNRPAQLQLRAEGRLHRQVYLDILSQCPFRLTAGEHYLPLTPDGVLPLDALQAEGVLGRHVLALVCPPTRFHVLYVKQLLGTGCRIAVEKPLTHSLTEGASLLPFGESVFAISHQLYKGEMLQFLHRCKEGQNL